LLGVDKGLPQSRADSAGRFGARNSLAAAGIDGHGRERPADHDVDLNDAEALSPADTRTEIVVIDDDPSVLAMIVLSFEVAGFPVIGFHDPLDALMWASESEPTCIVVDLKMPGVEGLDLVAAFCALARHSIILVSAYVDVMTTVDAMRLGVDDVVPKPATPEVLIASARRGLKVLATVPRTDVLTFTRRERQVADLVVAGRTTKQIAQTLGLSPRTIEFFRASLLKKTQSPNTAALVSALTRIGFLPGG